LDWHELQTRLILSIPLLASLVVALVYWKKAPAIAARMVQRDPTPVTNLSIDVRDIMMVAFSTAGVFLLVEGVRELTAIAYVAHQSDLRPEEFWNNTAVCSPLIEIALWLILGSRGIVNLLHRLRTAGVPSGGVDDGGDATR
jgi:hypothetical protein